MDRITPLHATERQLLALLMARHLLKTGGGHLDRDLGKFAETLLSAVADRRLSPTRLDRLFSAAWSGNSPAAETVFRAVLTALTQDRLLDILYTSPRTGETTERTVEPHHLQHYQGSWLLLAWCRPAGDWRKFFLSRMEYAHVLANGFAPRPQNAWKPNLEGAYGIFQGGKTIPVRLRFCAERARWIRLQNWHEKQRLIPLPDGRLELRLPVVDLRESIRKEIGKMGGLYGRQDPGSGA